MSRLAQIAFALDHGWQHSLAAHRVQQRAAARTDIAVLRVRRGAAGCWEVQREGGATEASFPTRLAAIEFAHLIGMSAGSYRAFFETTHGAVVEERFIPR